MDVILVFRSKFVRTDEFFDKFVEHVQTLPEFSDLLQIPAKVPIIKVYLGDIQFDLLFASVDDLKAVRKQLK